MNLLELKEIALSGEKEPKSFKETFNPPTILAMIQLCENVDDRARNIINDLLNAQAGMVDNLRERLHSSLNLLHTLVEQIEETEDEQYPKEAVVEYLKDCINLGMGLEIEQPKSNAKYPKEETE